MEFGHETTIRLYDTDAAGFIFFAALFRLAHEAFEEFMSHLGFPVADVVREGRFIFPVVHAKADYTSRLAIGDRVTARVSVTRIGRSSFTVRCRFNLPDGRQAGTVELVHATVAVASRKPVPIIEPLRRALGRYRESEK